jgi:hypothetical protein
MNQQVVAKVRSPQIDRADHDWRQDHEDRGRLDGGLCTLASFTDEEDQTTKLTHRHTSSLLTTRRGLEGRPFDALKKSF